MSLFSGYGGLDHGLLSVVEGEVVAVADVDPGACRLLAHRYPGVPNLGDVTTVDWSEWAGKVDAITGGTALNDKKPPSLPEGRQRGGRLRIVRKTWRISDTTS